MAQQSNVRTRTVSDPLSLRAFAHPIRLRLHGLVAREGALTAADAARQLGISQALASHHLRQLAKYGFVEPAEASDGRARPWRVRATSTRLAPATSEGRGPADVIERHTLEQAAEELADWQRDRDAADPRWAETAGATSALLYLSLDEFEELMGVWRREVERRAADRPVGHASRRPEDAIPVALTLVAVPIRPTEHGG